MIARFLRGIMMIHIDHRSSARGEEEARVSFSETMDGRRVHQLLRAAIIVALIDHSRITMYPRRFGCWLLSRRINRIIETRGSFLSP
jgi:hypothetical protein